jgi:hypothetical protein
LRRATGFPLDHLTFVGHPLTPTSQSPDLK